MARCPRGVAAVEMALVLPFLLALLMGIVSYGDYFLTAHLVQQAAHDAARASLAGMNATERKSIAVDTAKRMLDLDRRPAPRSGTGGHGRGRQSDHRFGPL
ncbi:TadE/TadG family type IV pilus assembly protein [Sphingomonas sp. I4]